MAENEVTTTDIEALKISEDDIATMSVTSLSDRPSEHSSQYGQKGLSAQEIKTKLSELPEHIAGNFNDLIDILLKLIPAIEDREVASISFNDDGKLFISFKDGDAPVTMSGSWVDNVADGGTTPPTAEAVKTYIDGVAIGVPEFNKTTGEITFKTLDGNEEKTIDLPLEDIIKNGKFEGGNLILTLWNDSEITVPSENLLNPVWISGIENKVSAAETDVADVKSDVKNITRRVENLEDVLVEEKVVESKEYITLVPSDASRYALLNSVGGMIHRLERNLAKITGFSSYDIAGETTNSLGTTISTTASGNFIEVLQAQFIPNASDGITSLYNGLFHIFMQTSLGDGEECTFSCDVTITNYPPENSNYQMAVFFGYGLLGKVQATVTNGRLVARGRWDASFGGVEIYLGGISAQFSNFMFERGHTDGKYVPYVLEEAKVTAIKVEHNFVTPPYILTTIPEPPISLSNGTSFILKGTEIILNGKLDGRNYTFKYNISLPSNKNLRLSGCPKGGSSTSYRLLISEFVNGNWVNDYVDTGEGLIFTARGDALYNIMVITANSDITVENLTFSPKITYEEPIEPKIYTLPADVVNSEEYGLGIKDIFYNRVAINTLDIENKRFYKNRVKKYVYYGTENWENGSSDYSYRIELDKTSKFGLSSHYSLQDWDAFKNGTDDGIYLLSSKWVYVRDKTVSSLEEFKAKLDRWAHEDNPLTVVCAFDDDTYDNIEVDDIYIDVEQGSYIVAVNNNAQGAHVKMTYIVAKGGSAE